MSKKQLKQLDETTVLVSTSTSLAASPNQKEDTNQIQPNEDIAKSLEILTDKIKLCEKSLLQLEASAKLQEEINKEILRKLDDISTKIEKLTSSRSNSENSGTLANDIDNLGDRIRTSLFV